MNKSEEKILNSFKHLLVTKEYDDITIKNILDDCHVGRTTFYAHYSTKEDLLKSILTLIFDHVFSHTLEVEKSHDFSQILIYDEKQLLTHMFYHFQDEQEVIVAASKSSCKHIFQNKLRDYLNKFADHYYQNKGDMDLKLPVELCKRILVDNLITILDYWLENSCAQSPEEVATYFISLLENISK